MKLSEQEKNKIINIACMIILFILVVLFLFLPKMKANNLYNQKISKLGKDLEELTKISNNPGVFEEQEKNILNDINTINDKIPSQAIIPQAISQIAESAKELGISIIEIKPQTSIQHRKNTEISESLPDIESQELPEIEEACIETPIELHLQCAYKQLGLYLDKLRHLNRLVVLDELDINKNKDISPELEVKLKISVFHLE